MLDYDDILQKKIDEIEHGASIEDALRDLPEEAGEIKDLIRLASAVRTVPHPEPLAETVIAQRRALLAAAARDTIPVARRAAPQPQRSFWGWLTPGAALSAAGAFAVLLLVAAAAMGFWFVNRGQDVVKVDAVSGQVQVAVNPAGTEWNNLSAGDTLRRGDRVRTLGASSATLVFHEGTRTFLGANSEVAFSELNGSGGKQIQVRIDQTAGETANRVTPLTGDNSYFLVDTPSGTASVHGTNFNVKVSQSGQAQFQVKTGEVRVRNEAGEVTLQAGQATAADPNGTIADPSFQFNTQGSLLAIDETTGVWNVSGVEFLVLDTTVINGPLEFGNTVRVTGRILDGNIRVADTIELASNSSQTASFTGTLEQIGGQDGVWVISGQPVKVNGQTDVDADLATGDPVKVTFTIIDGSTWLAVRIETLTRETEEPLPTPTATADPRAMPSYEFSPDELETSSCGSRDFDLTGTLKDTSGDAKDYAANVQLGYQIDQGGDNITMVELTPSSWTRIDAGQTVTFNIHVELAEKWLDDPDDKEVKLRVYVASATNRPDHLTGRLTVTLKNGCDQPTTPPDSGVQTPEDEDTPEPSPTEDPSIETGLCTGANPHPTGTKLSQRYGVPYEEIMFWFCQHYGFGEIELAYSLSRQYEKPVEEIFALRASGMGWGEIKKLLKGDGEEGGKPDKTDDGGNQNPGQGGDDGGKKDDQDRDKGGKPGSKKP